MKKTGNGLTIFAIVLGIVLISLITTVAIEKFNTDSPYSTDTVLEESTENSTEESSVTETYISQVLTLEQEEGEIFIYNGSGRELSLRAGSRLYEGYEIYTEDGYVWILLDDNGILKMDMDTQIRIEKTDSSLEIFLIEGEVFFNISEAFSETEDFSINTSTMKTGISGTSGIISTRTLVDSSTEFSIKLLEGKVELTYLIDNATEMHLAEMLEAGQQFKLTREEEDSDILISSLTDLTADDVNGFVAVEIRDSQEIQEKILSGNSAIDQGMLDEIINNAEEKLETDETIKREAKASSLLEVTSDKNDTTSDSVTDDSVTDDSATDDSATDDSTTDDSTTDDSTTDDSTTDDETEEVVEIMISYYSINENNLLEIFANQKVMSNENPFKPYFQPSAYGAWCQMVDGVYEEYDFLTPLITDTSLVWISTGL